MRLPLSSGSTLELVLFLLCKYLDKIGKAYFGMLDQPKAGNLLDLLGGGPGGGLLGR